MVRHLSVVPGTIFEAGNKSFLSWRLLGRSQELYALARRPGVSWHFVDEIDQLSQVAVEIYK
jgi:hypothetical protein